MRGSLKGVLARVDRLAARMQPSAEDIDAKIITTMSDEDLEALIVRQVEQAVGPADGFDTEDAYVEALCVTVPEERTKPTSYQESARHHWRRLHWLQDHTAHGTVVMVPHWSIQPHPDRLWGPGVIATCSCGETFPMFRATVPAGFRDLLHTED